MKDFDGWNELKKQLEVRDDITFYYHVREIWFCSLGINLGFEQDGKNEAFERPVAVLKKFNKHVFWGIPLTTKIKPDNKHYLTLKQGDFTYAAIVSQLRLYDSRRLQRRLYLMENPEFAKLKQAVRAEMGIKKSDSGKPESSEPEGHCSNIVANSDKSVKSVSSRLRKYAGVKTLSPTGVNGSAFEPNSSPYNNKKIGLWQTRVLGARKHCVASIASKSLVFNGFVGEHYS